MKILTIAILLTLALAVTACTRENDNETTTTDGTAETATPGPLTEPEPPCSATPYAYGNNDDNDCICDTPTACDACDPPTCSACAATTRTITDREGYSLTIPTNVNTVVTLGPSNAEILVALGVADRIIATDSFAADVAGLGAGVPRSFGIIDFDVEYIMDLMPDVLIVTGVARIGGDSPLGPIANVGISIVHMPTSQSMQGIYDDIRFLADVMGVAATAETVVAQMQAEFDAVAAIAATITTPRTVYFEVSPAPWMFSLGTGTFLHEIIELTGATNIFGDQEGWIPVSEEDLLELNPDVILTSTDFIPDPIGEIAERPGFDTLTAVQNGDIFQIGTAVSNRASPNVVIALRQIAEAVFPEYFSLNGNTR